MKMLYAQRFIISIGISLSLGYLSPMYAQAPDTLWTRTYDGLGYEEGYSIQQTAETLAHQDPSKTQEAGRLQTISAAVVRLILTRAGIGGPRMEAVSDRVGC